MGEHRDAKRRALLDAARSMLSEAPGTPPDINELTARAGMTRSNIYTYFTTRAELDDAVAEDHMPRWIDTVTGAVRDAGGGRRGVVAYVHTTLDLVAAGDHAILTALAAQLPDGPAHERLTRMHTEMTTPLRESLAESSRSDPQLTTELVMAVTFKASELIEGGRPLDEVLTAVDALIDPPG
ncbi:MAG: TetR/AcrR family transcriptional regulator [Dietzia sp.]|nr:TetR/AcrR family transcriptional regulator [Dietzia sp.]